MWHDFMQMGVPAALVMIAVALSPVALSVARTLRANSQRRIANDHSYNMRSLELKAPKMIDHREAY